MPVATTLAASTLPALRMQQGFRISRQYAVVFHYASQIRCDMLVIASIKIKRSWQWSIFHASAWSSLWRALPFSCTRCLRSHVPSSYLHAFSWLPELKGLGLVRFHILHLLFTFAWKMCGSDMSAQLHVWCAQSLCINLWILSAPPVAGSLCSESISLERYSYGF